MPWPVHPTGFLGARGDSDTYRIERSLRFNASDTAYLARTPSASSNQKLWTFSVWCKLTTSYSNERPILGARRGNGNGTVAQFTTGGALEFFDYNGSYNWRLITTRLFRDPSSWYHFVFAYDSDNATSSLRVRIYVNGVEETSFSTSTYPTLSFSAGINQNVEQRIGGDYAPTPSCFDGYLTEANLIDGQALTPSSFGETDPYTGRWKAKAYSGTYGTNGFYLSFKDNTSTTTLGYDDAGSNDWTLNNFSVTAGAGNDSLVDSPTNYGSGSGTVGNFCTWNPLVPGDSSANGNLDVTNDTARGNHELMKYDSYWEITSTGGTCLAGIISTAATSTITVGSAKTFGFKLSEAGVFEYANITDGSSFTSQATATTPPFPYASTGASITASINCGQRPFAGMLPTGYKPICTTSLDQPTIQKPSKYMDALAYTGTGASNSISSLGFSPDLVWIKNRGTTTSHAIYDTTRGAQSQLSSDTTGDQVTSSSGLTSFDTNGFTIGTSTLVNTSGTQYVAWSWDEEPKAGFDIVSYTGNGANRTIAHNLGVAPKMIIVKARTTAGADQGWPVYHASVAADPETDYLLLNSTAAVADLNTVWNDTAPTSSVFSVGTSALVNTNNDTYIAYLFSEVDGFSKFGSYTGNGSADGPFVWCGFRPKWICIRSIGGTSKWVVHDSQRNSSNITNAQLNPNAATAEDTADNAIDILSNGFKPRSLNSATNGATTITFAAFAESPFKYARAR